MNLANIFNHIQALATTKAIVPSTMRGVPRQELTLTPERLRVLLAGGDLEVTDMVEQHLLCQRSFCEVVGHVRLNLLQEAITTNEGFALVGLGTHSVFVHGRTSEPCVFLHF